MGIRIGLDQVDKRAPRWYRRVVNALIVFVVPATGTAVASLPEEVMSDRWKVLLGIGVSWLLGALKGLQYVLGEDVKTEESDGTKH